MIFYQQNEQVELAGDRERDLDDAEHEIERLRSELVAQQAEQADAKLVRAEVERRVRVTVRRACLFVDKVCASRAGTREATWVGERFIRLVSNPLIFALSLSLLCINIYVSFFTCIA